MRRGNPRELFRNLQHTSQACDSSQICTSEELCLALDGCSHPLQCICTFPEVLTPSTHLPLHDVSGEGEIGHVRSAPGAIHCEESVRHRKSHVSSQISSHQPIKLTRGKSAKSSMSIAQPSLPTRKRPYKPQGSDGEAVYMVVGVRKDFICFLHSNAHTAHTH